MLDRLAQIHAIPRRPEALMAIQSEAATLDAAYREGYPSRRGWDREECARGPRRARNHVKLHTCQFQKMKVRKLPRLVAGVGDEWEY